MKTDKNPLQSDQVNGDQRKLIEKAGFTQVNVKKKKDTTSNSWRQQNKEYQISRDSYQNQFLGRNWDQILVTSGKHGRPWQIAVKGGSFINGDEVLNWHSANQSIWIRFRKDRWQAFVLNEETNYLTKRHDCSTLDRLLKSVKKYKTKKAVEFKPREFVDEKIVINKDGSVELKVGGFRCFKAIGMFGLSDNRLSKEELSNPDSQAYVVVELVKSSRRGGRDSYIATDGKVYHDLKHIGAGYSVFRGRTKLSKADQHNIKIIVNTYLEKV